MELFSYIGFAFGLLGMIFGLRGMTSSIRLNRLEQRLKDLNVIDNEFQSGAS